MLDLSLACADYDRTVPLARGLVRPAGIRLNVITLPVEEIFFRMIKYREFDAAELSLSSYVASLRADPSPFVAIPVFPSRSFRHGSIFVNRRSSITAPADLAGRRVGTPEYEMTAGVWIRGILADHYGLDFRAPVYLTGGLEEPGRKAKTNIEVPHGVHVDPIAEDASLSQLLAAGEIDALYTARAPSCFISGHSDIVRLFPDFMDEEVSYFERTQIFPIMHTVVVRRDTYEEHAWVARELMKAMELARVVALRRLRESVALPVMLPWLASHLELTNKVMGDDYWPYGVEPNRNTLETFLDYARQQGIADRPLQPNELFAPETVNSARV